MLPTKTMDDTKGMADKAGHDMKEGADKAGHAV